MNDKDMSFTIFEKAVNLLKRGSKLNIREISGEKMVLENEDFVIEIIPKEQTK